MALTDKEARMAIYNSELGTMVRTGDLGLQIRQSYIMEQERNFKMAVLIACISGIGFLYSIFGMWRP